MTNNTVKTGSTLRKNSKNQSYLTMFGTWLHLVWCTLVSLVLSVPKLVGGLGKVGGAQLWLIRLSSKRSRQRDYQEGNKGRRES